MGSADRERQGPPPCASGQGKAAPDCAPRAVAAIVLCLLGVVIGIPQTRLLLLPPKEAGIREHALGVRNPLAIVLPIPLLLAAAGISVRVLFMARKGRRNWRADSCLLAAATVLMLALHVASWALGGHHMRRYAGGGGGNPPCVRNLGRLAALAIFYAEGHEGQFPDSLGQIVRAESLPPSILLCTWLDHPEDERIEDGFATSFVYLGKGQRRHDIPSDQILIYERPGIHDANGSYAAYADGHVE